MRWRATAERRLWYHRIMDDPEGVGPPGGGEPEEGVPDFDDSYLGTPPWDIGRPQPEFLRLADAGVVTGRVLDVGCGTGEHALMAAGRGLDVMGVDSAPRAIAAARRKAAERGVDARFLEWDARRLDELDERFDTVIDCGLFHVFDDDDRARYVESLAAVVPPGGRYLLCCFSDRQPGDWGPRRVAREELEAAFDRGWTVTSIEAGRMVTNLDPPFVEAWLAVVERA